MTSVLDDLEGISRIDKSGMCGTLEKFPEYFKDAFTSFKIQIPNTVCVSEKLIIRYKKPKNIIVIGMGGSGIGGKLLKDWLGRSIALPIEVCQSYTLPTYANEETLIFATSYSGNTEETLSCFLDAIESRCMVIAISSGGLLQKFSEKILLPFVKIPQGHAPRSALPYLFVPLVASLQSFQLVPGFTEQIDEAIAVLNELRDEIKPERPTTTNQAKKIAHAVRGYVPVIYASGLFQAVACRMKHQFNENSKTPSIVGFFPEMNHNEVEGWTSSKEFTKNFCVILIRDNYELPEIRTRIEITKTRILNEKAGKVLELWSRGKGKLARMLSTLYMGDFVSVYLAILYGFDPTPINVINDIKTYVKEKVDTTNIIKRRFKELMLH